MMSCRIIIFYVLKRKMELEYQQRKRQQAPRSRTKQW